MEEKWRHSHKNCTDFFKKYHKNLLVYSTGLHINAKYPHLGGSRDGIIVCDCPEKGLLEIKCLHKYHNGLEDWQDDKNFPLDESGQIQKDHMYYDQVQGQLPIVDMNFLIVLSGHHYWIQMLQIPY